MMDIAKAVDRASTAILVLLVIVGIYSSIRVYQDHTEERERESNRAKIEAEAEEQLRSRMQRIGL